MPVCGIATEGCPDTGLSQVCGAQGTRGGIWPSAPLCYGYGFDGCSYNKGNQGPQAKRPNCPSSSGQLFNLVDEPPDYAEAARDWMAFADKYATNGSDFLNVVRAGRVTTPGTTGDEGTMRSNLQTFFGACEGCNDPNSNRFIGTLSFHAFANTDSGHRAPFSGNVDWILNTAVTSLRNAFPGKKLAMTNFGVLGHGSTAKDEVVFIKTLFSKLASAGNRKLDYVFYFAARDYGGGATHNGLCEGGIAQTLVRFCGGEMSSAGTIVV